MSDDNRKNDGNEHGGLSRRGFLKGLAVAGGAAAIGGINGIPSVYASEPVVLRLLVELRLIRVAACLGLIRPDAMGVPHFPPCSDPISYRDRPFRKLPITYHDRELVSLLAFKSYSHLCSLVFDGAYSRPERVG